MGDSKVSFIFPKIHWSCSVDMDDFINALSANHPSEMEGLIKDTHLIMDETDAEAMAFVVEDYLRTSRGSFGGGLGRGWLIQVI